MGKGPRRSTSESRGRRTQLEVITRPASAFLTLTSLVPDTITSPPPAAAVSRSAAQGLDGAEPGPMQGKCSADGLQPLQLRAGGAASRHSQDVPFGPRPGPLTVGSIPSEAKLWQEPGLAAPGEHTAGTGALGPREPPPQAPRAGEGRAQPGWGAAGAHFPRRGSAETWTVPGRGGGAGRSLAGVETRAQGPSSSRVGPRGAGAARGLQRASRGPGAPPAEPGAGGSEGGPGSALRTHRRGLRTHWRRRCRHDPGGPTQRPRPAGSPWDSGRREASRALRASGPRADPGARAGRACPGRRYWKPLGGGCALPDS